MEDKTRMPKVDVASDTKKLSPAQLDYVSIAVLTRMCIKTHDKTSFPCDLDEDSRTTKFGARSKIETTKKEKFDNRTQSRCNCCWNLHLLYCGCEARKVP
jgi:hypothetical protein